MKLPLAFAICGAALLAQTEAARNPRTSPQDIAAGAKSFRSHCAPCHGLHGEGGRGPNLARGRFYHGSSDADLLNNISNGISGTEMPGLYYSADRVWQIVAYVRSLSAQAPAQPSGDPQRGAALFHSGGCIQCHRVKGEGGRLGPDLTNVGQSRSFEYLRQSVIDPNAAVPEHYGFVTCLERTGVKTEGFLMNEDTYTIQFIDLDEHLRTYAKEDLKKYDVSRISRMPSYKGAFSEAQLGDLLTYLSSLRPTEGGH